MRAVSGRCGCGTHALLSLFLAVIGLAVFRRAVAIAGASPPDRVSSLCCLRVTRYFRCVLVPLLYFCARDGRDCGMCGRAARLQSRAVSGCRVCTVGFVLLQLEVSQGRSVAMAQTRRLLPVLGAVGLGVCLCVAAIVTLSVQRPLALESSKAEHAAENSFFDSLAAEDLAKDRKSHNAKAALGTHKTLSASQARALAASYYKHVGAAKAHSPAVHPAHKMKAKHWKPLPASALVHFSKFKGVHMHKKAGAKPAAGKKTHSAGSMRAEFAKAQEQLKEEKLKMHHMEQKDKVKAAEQQMDLEHLKAQQQASAYERHLTKLNNAVFPRSMEDSVMSKSSAHAVSHALVDDMHVPKITKADYERHPMMAPKAAHGSNKLYRRVKNSGKDFAKQVS